jgi:hypothetical protein
MDTTGRKQNIKEEYLRACGGIITFDKGDRDSFEAVTDLYREFYVVNPKEKVPLSVVGLITESMEITTKEGHLLAIGLSAPYYETKPLNTDITSKILEDLTIRMIDSKHRIVDA